MQYRDQILALSGESVTKGLFVDAYFRMCKIGQLEMNLEHNTNHNCGVVHKTKTPFPRAWGICILESKHKIHPNQTTLFNLGTTQSIDMFARVMCGIAAGTIKATYRRVRVVFTPAAKNQELSEGIQNVDLCRIRSGSGDKKTSGMDAENKLQSIYTNKYRINLDHPILTDHGIIYPQALYNDLIFELTLAPASQVVRGSDTTKLVYKLENIQLEYETIRSKRLADEATSTYTTGKEFAYDLVMRERVVPVNRGSDTRLNLQINPQRRSLKGILLLFINPYTAGARDSKSYFNPDITKVQVTVNGVPNQIYNEGISGADM